MNEIKIKNKKERRKFVLPDDQIKLNVFLNEQMKKDPDYEEEDL